MFGFLNINKPKNMTSHDVIYQVRKILNIKKVGHAGTLDPLAQGVLPVGVGYCTRLLEFLPDEKEYEAELKFGYISDTYDSEGNIEKYSDCKIQMNDIKNALIHFVGDISQKPPIYSAVKVNGRKLYDYARKGIDTIIPERIIHVDKIDLLNFNSDENTAKIRIKCSKGTYIRSIIHDLGKKLNTGAYMTELVRTLSSGMKIDESINLDDVSQVSLISPENILKFPVVELTKENFKRVKNGNLINVNKTNGFVFLRYDNNIVSLANIINGTAYSKKVFVP